MIVYLVVVYEYKDIFVIVESCARRQARDKISGDLRMPPGQRRDQWRLTEAARPATRSVETCVCRQAGDEISGDLRASPGRRQDPWRPARHLKTPSNGLDVIVPVRSTSKNGKRK
jgi:hypothetical protein